jgi:hypothetical protein
MPEQHTSLTKEKLSYLRRILNAQSQQAMATGIDFMVYYVTPS